MEGRPLEDAELVERARRGDAGAYEEIVRRYRDAAMRAAYAVAGPDAEDAVQEAFVKAYYALRRFRAGAPLRPWLLRIVANEARNRRKAAGRRERLALRVVDRPDGDAAPSPEAAVLERERDESLLGALARVSAQDRLIIAYRYFLELPEDEMAQALDCPRGTVKSRLSRAMSRLRRELGPGGKP